MHLLVLVACRWPAWEQEPSSPSVVRCWGLQKGEWDRADGGEAPGSASLMWYLALGDSGSPWTAAFAALLWVPCIYVCTYTYICITAYWSIVSDKQIGAELKCRRTLAISTSSDFMKQRRFVHYQREWNTRKVKLQSFQDNVWDAVV